MGRSAELQDPRVQYYRCLYWGIVFLILVPPLIWITMSAVDQSSIKFSLEDYYIAGVESYDGSNLNQSIIYFKLNLANDCEVAGIYYDNLNLTFSYYTGEGIIVPVGNYTIPGFRQGVKAETDRKDFVVTAQGWQEISNMSVSSDVVVFRVDLATAVRFRHYITGIKSKRLRTMAWCKVEVDRITGKKKSNKAVQLKHMIERHPNCGWIIFAFIIFLLSVFVVPCLVFICFGVVFDYCMDN